MGAEEEWRRPGPTPAQRRVDVWITVAFLVLGVLGLEVMLSMGGLGGLDGGGGGDRPVQYAAVVSAAVLLVFRRSHPLSVAAGASAHLLVLGSVVPLAVASLPMQVLYFFAIYSGVAWARERRAVPYVVLAIMAAMFLWVAWFLALASGVQAILGEEAPQSQGLIPPVAAAVMWVLLTNLVYFVGAIVLGQVAWRGAHRTAQVVAQADTIRAQSARLRDQAVVDERLRIARELHDVVAHHVSVMGVQAAAARRVLTTHPEAAAEALSAVERSSRDAVGQMRDLLGTLRSGEAEADGSPGAVAGDRLPQPGLGDLPVLVDQAGTPMCEVRHTLVESTPGLSAQVPGPVQLSVYRVVQEALANMRRHSTARHASVTVRVVAGAGGDDGGGTGRSSRDHEGQDKGGVVEVEVLDDGAPRVGTSGTGLGHVGMRERAHHLGGGVEVGPRAERGYRVRVWFPLEGVPRDRTGARGGSGSGAPAPVAPAPSGVTDEAAVR
nr:histidine kinase [Ornithinimicrobium sediminis]